MSILTLGKTHLEPPNQKPLYARSGWQIPVEYPPKRDASLLEIQAVELKHWHPRAKLRSLSTYPYNCVGMIFAARRAWIEIDYIYDILKEDGYGKINRNQVMEGDVVLYERNKNPTHVGMIVAANPVHPTSTALNILVLSKWGFNPEFIHHIEDVPAQFGEAAAFFTEGPRS